MSIKRILVPIETVDAGGAALKAAMTIAKELQASLEALHIRERPHAPPSGYYPLGAVVSEDYIEALEKAAVERAARLKKMFEETVRDAPSARWIEREGAAPFDIGIAARVADLVVFSKTEEAAKFRETSNLEEVLFQAGRPVLISPPVAREAFPRRILFAWNGSREAARAMAAATPFFTRAEAVAAVSFGSLGPDRPGADDAAATLRLHGAKVEVIEREKEDRDAESFLELAREWRADLCVMGAYSHARWRQVILGGFTRGMLAQSELPVMLAH